MKLARKVGVLSEIWQVFIRDTASVTGAGLTGLLFNSASLTAYYHRDTDTVAVAISLATMTIGTFTSGGFKEIDATNLPGWYQFCPPNAALASGAKSCGFQLKGATNMVPLPIEVDLDAQIDVTHWNGTVVATPNTAGVPVVDVGRINNISTSSVSAVGAFIGNATAAIVVDAGGLVSANAVQFAGQTITCAASVTINANLGAAAAPGSANGMLIGGGNAASTFASITCSGAFSINGVSNVAQTGDSFIYPSRTVIRGTVGSTGLSVNGFDVSALDVAGTVLNQFRGAAIIFDKATTTAGLRGVRTPVLTSSVAALPSLSVVALPTTPVSGDTFSLV